ncbi:MAG: SpoVR family protein [Deltaproteobacteria bacterium]|nr:SpoVR family protein [Deltaproteobacteria bacterium]
MSLSPQLRKMQDEIRGYAVAYGLDFFEVIFEMLDWRQINEVAAYGGFPNRYPHWRFGMEYERLAKSYSYGLSKIYEMVINNDPCYAYLLHSNNLVDQKMVMAHVYGHSDFFKCNQYFAHTNRKMMDEMANHRTRVMRYIDRYGHDTVENFIDVSLSLDNLIDYHAPAIRRADVVPQPREDDEEERDGRIQKLGKDARPYMDRYLNPPEFLEAQRQQIAEERKKARQFPERPQRDVLNFLLHYAPLESWERDVLSLIREEALYYAPQAQTKVMNEGWACYWHSTIMTQRALKDSELIDYADHHSGTVAMGPHNFNPYKIGLELFRDIEERWNKGRCGKEYDECTDMRQRAQWNKNLGLGRDKIFEVRRIYNDLTFIDTFLTPEFCQEQRLFIYAYDLNTDQYEMAGRTFDQIKQQLLTQLTNCGSPILDVVDANHENRNILVLKHVHEGIDLRIDYARECLKSLQRIWKRPVAVDTILDGIPKTLSFDGEQYAERRPK